MLLWRRERNVKYTPPQILEDHHHYTPMASTSSTSTPPLKSWRPPSPMISIHIGYPCMACNIYLYPDSSARIPSANTASMTPSPIKGTSMYRTLRPTPSKSFRQCPSVLSIPARVIILISSKEENAEAPVLGITWSMITIRE